MNGLLYLIDHAISFQDTGHPVDDWQSRLFDLIEDEFHETAFDGVGQDIPSYFRQPNDPQLLSKAILTIHRYLITHPLLRSRNKAQKFCEIIQHSYILFDFTFKGV